MKLKLNVSRCDSSTLSGNILTPRICGFKAICLLECSVSFNTDRLIFVTESVVYFLEVGNDFLSCPINVTLLGHSAA
jgi:hypothetical protein